MTITIRAAAVLLDMDGTIVDSSTVVDRVWTEWALRHSLDPAEVFDVIHGRQGHESMAILLPHRSREENLADNKAMLERETAQTEGVVPVAGALDLMTSLADLPHALVTSSTVELAHARMSATGLPVPTVAVTGDRVATSKPHPEAFLTAATELGVPPSDCVALEDSGTGIASARAAGMRVIGVGVAARRYDPDWAVLDLTSVSVHPENDGLTIIIES